MTLLPGGPRPRTSARSSADAPTLAARLQAAVPIVVVGLTLLVLLRLSVASMLGAGLAVAAAAMLLLLVVRGLEGSAVVLVAAGIALSPMDNLKPVSSIEFASVSDVLLLLGIALLIPLLASRPAPGEGLFYLGVAGFILVAIVSSVISDQPGQSLVNILRLVVGAVLLPLVFALWRPRRELVVWFAAAYVAGTTFNVAASYWNAIGDGGRRIGYSSHPNVLGLAAMLGLALVPFLLAAVPRQWRWLVLVGAASCAWGVWISGSRAALLVAVAVAVLYVIASRSIAVAMVLVGAAIPTFYLVADAVLSGEKSSDNAFGRLLGGGSANGSDLQREQLADYALHKFLDHPVLGNGLAEVMEAHNIYLQVAAAVGVVGAAFYVVILLAAVLRSLTLPRPFTLLVLPVIGYAMVGSMTTFLWERYIWAVLALPFLVALQRTAPIEPPDVDPASTHLAPATTSRDHS